MKKVAVIENNYNVYMDRNKVIIRFEVDNHSVAIENFEYYERMSEETIAFSGDLILDGKNVGDCSNDGKGGCANYHAFKNWDLARKVESSIANVECYSFPSLKLDLFDVLDSIANMIVVFKDNNVKTITKAKIVATELQKIADKYRTKYAV